MNPRDTLLFENSERVRKEKEMKTNKDNDGLKAENARLRGALETISEIAADPFRPGIRSGDLFEIGRIAREALEK